MSTTNETKKTNNLKAVVCFKDGTSAIVKAELTGGRWMIGGDFAGATFSLGAIVLIYNLKTRKIYRLNGCRLKFQDSMTDADVARMTA